jgi:hypothetical protein
VTRLVHPRDAFSALNELHQVSVEEIVVTSVPEKKFKAELKIDDVCYTGIGNSKLEARIKASERFFRACTFKEFQKLAERREKYLFNLPMIQITGLKASNISTLLFKLYLIYSFCAI